MRVTLAQLNPIVGDVEGNARLVRDAIEHARRDRARVLLLPEMVLLGYPPRDLLLRAGVVEACEHAVEELARETRGSDLVVVLGHPRRREGPGRALANSASVLRDGRVECVYDKQLLPGYDVFDEDRYFEPGRTTCVVDVDGTRVAILICEDLWRAGDVVGAPVARPNYQRDPVADAVAAGARTLLVLSASPFTLGKGARHRRHLAAIARRHRARVALVNQVGGNDDLVFDGRSAAYGPDGAHIAELAHFESEKKTVELPEINAGSRAVRENSVGIADEFDEMSPDSEDAETWAALRLGLRDYCWKTGHRRVVLGLSGGIDSAVVATLAASALGSENVLGVMMPSRFSSEGSIADSLAVAENIGLDTPITTPIREPHAMMSETLAEAAGGPICSLADENLQARLRGLVLMGLSNETGRLVLVTGNKSELAAGYCTLYGDMCGAVAPLGDVLKTRVYRLARWINTNHTRIGLPRAPVPASVLTKPPSAELRPNQTDQDALPPYHILDEIIHRVVHLEESPAEIPAATGFEPDLVDRVVRLIDREEFKRFQAPIVLKITGRAFGRGRPMPLVMKSTGVANPGTTRTSVTHATRGTDEAT